MELHGMTVDLQVFVYTGPLREKPENTCPSREATNCSRPNYFCAAEIKWSGDAEMTA